MFREVALTKIHGNWATAVDRERNQWRVAISSAIPSGRPGIYLYGEHYLAGCEQLTIDALLTPEVFTGEDISGAS